MTSAADILAQVRQAVDALLYSERPAVNRIHVTPLAVKTYEDWTRVRSVGRASRRRAKHRQNIRSFIAPFTFVAGGVMYVHETNWVRMVQKAPGDLYTDLLTSRISFFGVPVTFASGIEVDQAARRYGIF